MMYSDKTLEIDPALRVYLLGRIDFDDALIMQRNLVDEIANDNAPAALIVCGHPESITVGRNGSHRHIHIDRSELAVRGWPIKWVNRGGGCLFHSQGQMAAYPILPLRKMRVGIREYLERFRNVIIRLLDDFSIRGQRGKSYSGVYANSRLIAHVGIAIREWVTYYGAALNIDPALEPFKSVQCDLDHNAPMTSMERERRGRLNPALVRQRFIEYFSQSFGFSRTSLFTDHTLLH